MCATAQEYLMRTAPKFMYPSKSVFIAHDAICLQRVQQSIVNPDIGDRRRECFVELGLICDLNTKAVSNRKGRVQRSIGHLDTGDRRRDCFVELGLLSEDWDVVADNALYQIIADCLQPGHVANVIHVIHAAKT